MIDQSDWEFLQFAQGTRRLVVVIDLDKGRRSVTNDIDNVVATLWERGITNVGTSLIYRDSTGHFDQVLFDAWKFVDFRSLKGTNNLNVAAELVGFRLSLCVFERLGN